MSEVLLYSYNIGNFHTKGSNIPYRKIYKTPHNAMKEKEYKEVYDYLSPFLKEYIVKGIIANTKYIITNKNPSLEKQFHFYFDEYVVNAGYKEKRIIENILYEISQICDLYLVVKEFFYEKDIKADKLKIRGICFQAFEKSFVFDYKPCESLLTTF